LSPSSAEFGLWLTGTSDFAVSVNQRMRKLRDFQRFSQRRWTRRAKVRQPSASGDCYKT
jgi:hypothetical protein